MTKADRIRSYRKARAAGLRPRRIWAPDTSRAGFAEECRRQSELVAAADANDASLGAFLDAALAEMSDP